MTTFYDILGVRADADDETIRAAFRRLAKTWHPDVNRGNDRAAQRFRHIVAAYDMLKNADKRSGYDRELDARRALARQARRLDLRYWALAVAVSVAVSGAVTMVVAPYVLSRPDPDPPNGVSESQAAAATVDLETVSDDLSRRSFRLLAELSQRCVHRRARAA